MGQCLRVTPVAAGRVRGRGFKRCCLNTLGATRAGSSRPMAAPLPAPKLSRSQLNEEQVRASKLRSELSALGSERLKEQQETSGLLADALARLQVGWEDRRVDHPDGQGGCQPVDQDSARC